VVAPSLDCPNPKPKKIIPKKQPQPPPQLQPQPESRPIICPTCPAVLAQAPCPDATVSPVAEGFWSTYGKDTVFSFLGVLLGALVSFYATILFERYKRFRETLLEIAKARQLNEGYPISTKNLHPVYSKAVDYWRLLESKQWTLNADGHVEAAAQVGRLVSLAHRSAACIENLLNKNTKGLPENQYLSAFQSEFSRIYNNNFVRFEERLKPSVKALLQPFPHAYAPVSAKVILVDFFENLL